VQVLQRLRDVVRRKRREKWFLHYDYAPNDISLLVQPRKKFCCHPTTVLFGSCSK
jgi:hypothetical protein